MSPGYGPDITEVTRSGQCPYFLFGAEDMRDWVAAAGRAVDCWEIRTDDRAVPSRDDLWRLLDRATGVRP